MGDLTSADIPIIILQKDHLCVCSTSGLCGRSDPTAHKRILTSRMRAEDEKEHLRQQKWQKQFTVSFGGRGADLLLKSAAWIWSITNRYPQGLTGHSYWEDLSVMWCGFCHDFRFCTTVPNFPTVGSLKVIFLNKHYFGIFDNRRKIKSCL